MKGVLVVLMCLACFANGGCKTLESVKDNGFNLEAIKTGLQPSKSPEQKKQEKRQAWIEEKSDEVASELGEPYPYMFSNAAGGYSIEKIPVNAYEAFKVALTEDLSQIENNISEESLAELRKKYDAIRLSIKEVQETRAYINAQFEKVAHLGHDDDNYYMFHSYPLLDKTPVEAVKEDFYSKHSQYSEYKSWLSSAEKNFENVSTQISNYGLQTEKEKFLQRARKNECPKVSEFNFWGNNLSLSRGVPYGVSEPDVTKIYDLAGFKVLQSISNGILLMPDYQDAYRAQPVFILTDKSYPDGFGFKGGDQLVCYRGKMKKYVSALGSTKTVYQFKAINDPNKYYFLPWGN
jgi:DNA-binding transcriptional MerR regulator